MDKEKRKQSQKIFIRESEIYPNFLEVNVPCEVVIMTDETAAEYDFNYKLCLTFKYNSINLEETSKIVELNNKKNKYTIYIDKPVTISIIDTTYGFLTATIETNNIAYKALNSSKRQIIPLRGSFANIKKNQEGNLTTDSFYLNNLIVKETFNDPLFDYCARSKHLFYLEINDFIKNHPPASITIIR